MATWLLTSTTYGTWLPGDLRRSVTSVRERRDDEAFSGSRREHDLPGTAYEIGMPGLQRSAAARMKGPRVLLSGAQAQRLLDQLRETARHRHATLHAAAIMANHFHLIVTADDHVEPGKLLGDLKSYGSRVLNEAFGQPRSGTWWTARGSKRKLPDNAAIASAINYVLHRQPNPLAIWSPNQKS
ncbi:MAG: transposase [Planctomycetota bacterium]